MKPWHWVALVIIAALALGGSAAMNTGPGGIVQQFAQAIANAEGWFVAGSRPQRNNNPGNLTDSAGAFRIFSTVADGWAALYEQVSLMFYGGSAHYDPSMTIAQVGAIYAAGDSNWSNNVASYLGVTPQT